MRIFAQFVVRNEASRYLDAVLRWTHAFTHDIFVYDDRSDDDTVAIAEQYATVVRRPDLPPSFMENEGEFREGAWKAFIYKMKPEVGDLILALDADEFLLPRRPIVGELPWSGSLEIPVHEVFGLQDGRPMVRTDGYWGGITGKRVLVYNNNRPEFLNRKMGCGSLPVDSGPVTRTDDMEILHYGYCRVEDRYQKHDRYFGRPGHSAAHIASILRPGTLEPWTGVQPLL